VFRRRRRRQQEPEPQLLITQSASFLTPGKFPRTYTRLCEVVGLPPTATGYGLVHCVDERGRHWTTVTEDLEYLQGLRARTERSYGVEIPEEKFPIKRRGWPDDWASEAGIRIDGA
jgi:hypothetical protein